MWSQNQAFLECSGWLVETLVSLKAFRFCSYMDDPKSTSSTETLDFWHPTKVDVLAFYSSYYKQVQVFPPDHQRLKVDSFEKWHLIPTNGWLESLTSKRSLFYFLRPLFDFWFFPVSPMPFTVIILFYVKESKIMSFFEQFWDERQEKQAIRILAPAQFSSTAL